MKRYETDTSACRDQIDNKYREAYRLSLEIGMKAQDRDEPEMLAEAARALDSAVELLERARGQLVTA